MEQLGFYIVVLLTISWLLYMSRKYGLANIFDALTQGCSKFIWAILTILLLIFALYLMGLFRW